MLKELDVTYCLMEPRPVLLFERKVHMRFLQELWI